MQIMSKKEISLYKDHLIDEEKAPATIEKYIRDVNCFAQWLQKEDVYKSDVVEYKAYLIKKYAPASVNSALSSLNSFFDFCKCSDLKIKQLKIQKTIFVQAENELLKEEYNRLLSTALEMKKDDLFWIMQTICSTGIRVSELKFITVEALNKGVAEIYNKGKKRRVFLPMQLCVALNKYTTDRNIKSGPVFISKNGIPLDRSNIWSSMKKLCIKSNVSPQKVFPHNLRHLFAHTYYSAQKDIVRLSDILGHSSINTTRIYTMESGEVHKEQIQNLGLLYEYKSTT